MSSSSSADDEEQRSRFREAAVDGWTVLSQANTVTPTTAVSSDRRKEDQSKRAVSEDYRSDLLGVSEGAATYISKQLTSLLDASVHFEEMNNSRQPDATDEVATTSDAVQPTSSNSISLFRNGPKLADVVDDVDNGSGSVLAATAKQKRHREKQRRRRFSESDDSDDAKRRRYLKEAVVDADWILKHSSPVAVAKKT